MTNCVCVQFYIHLPLWCIWIIFIWVLFHISYWFKILLYVLFLLIMSIRISLWWYIVCFFSLMDWLFFYLLIWNGTFQPAKESIFGALSVYLVSSVASRHKGKWTILCHGWRFWEKAQMEETLWILRASPSLVQSHAHTHNTWAKIETLWPMCTPTPLMLKRC